MAGVHRISHGCLASRIQREATQEYRLLGIPVQQYAVGGLGLAHICHGTRCASGLPGRAQRSRFIQNGSADIGPHSAAIRAIHVDAASRQELGSRPAEHPRLRSMMPCFKNEGVQ